MRPSPRFLRHRHKCNSSGLCRLRNLWHLTAVVAHLRQRFLLGYVDAGQGLTSSDAPCWIQARIQAISSGFKGGLPSDGMNFLWSAGSVMRCNRILLSGLPGIMTAPFFSASHRPVIGVHAEIAFDLFLSMADDAVSIENRIEVAGVKRVGKIEGFRLHRSNATKRFSGAGRTRSNTYLRG